jgi:hypothetical protein
MHAVIEDALSADVPAFFLGSVHRAPPFFWLGFFRTNDHSSFLALLLIDSGLSLYSWFWPLGKLDDYLWPCWFGNIGDKVLDIELILIDLFLNFFFDLVNPTIILAMNISALVVIL